MCHIDGAYIVCCTVGNGTIQAECTGFKLGECSGYVLVTIHHDGIDLCRQQRAMRQESWVVLRELGFVQFLRGSLAEAERSYTAFLKKTPDDVIGLRLLGRLQWCRRDYAAAEKSYGEALQRDPGDPQTLRELASFYGAQGRFTEARPLAQAALEREDDFFSRAMLAWILVAGDLDVEYGIELARSALSTPPFDDPTDEWRTAQPNAPVPEAVLGLAYRKQGNDRMALVFLEEAARMRPKDTDLARELESVQESLSR